MIPRRQLFFAIAATLVLAAWLNASQEHRACSSGNCAPMAATLESLAAEMKVSSR